MYPKINGKTGISFYIKIKKVLISLEKIYWIDKIIKKYFISIRK